MAFPVVVSSTPSTKTAASTSSSFAQPSGVVAGDLVVLAISVDINAPVSTATVGWSRVVHQTLTETFAVFVGRVGAAIFPLVLSHGSAGWAARTLVVRNVHPTQAPEAASTTQGAGLGATVAVPAITPSWGTADALYLAAVMSVWPGNGPTTAPSGYGNRETSILGAATIGTEVDVARRVARVAAEAPAPWTGASALVAYASALVVIRGIDSDRAAGGGISIGGTVAAVATIERPAAAAVNLSGPVAGVAVATRLAAAGVLLGGGALSVGTIARSASQSVALVGEGAATGRISRGAGAGIDLSGAIDSLGQITGATDGGVELAGVADATGVISRSGDSGLIVEGAGERELRGIEVADGQIGLEGSALAFPAVPVSADAVVVLEATVEALPGLVEAAGGEIGLDGWGVTPGARFVIDATDGLQLGGVVEDVPVVETWTLPEVIDIAGKGAPTPAMSEGGDGWVGLESRPVAQVRFSVFAIASVILSDNLDAWMMLMHESLGGVELGGAVEVVGYDDQEWPGCIRVRAEAPTLSVAAEADMLVVRGESPELTVEATEC